MVPAGTLEALLGVGVVTRGIGPLGHEGFFKAMAFPAPAQSGACLSCHLWVVKGVIPDVDSCRTGVPSMAL